MATSASLRSRLLRSALPLVQTYGFTREALARSVLSLAQNQHEHKEPLSDQAVSSLFGEGDEARRTLIQAWLDEGVTSIREMGESHQDKQLDLQRQQEQSSPNQPPLTLAQVLHSRLTYNEPVLPHIPEAFALLITPGIPPLDPLPAVKHVAEIANEACYAINDKSLYWSWYTNRAAVATIYAAAELHQLASPATAHAFLDTLIENEGKLKKSATEVGVYAEYVLRSWKGIARSYGII